MAKKENLIYLERNFPRFYNDCYFPIFLPRKVYKTDCYAFLLDTEIL